MTLQERTPVPILQNEWEFEQLLKEYRALDPKSIISIGEFFGGTLYHWLKEGYPSAVICVDLPIGSDDGRYNQMLTSRDLWKDWTEEKGVTLYDIKGNSTDPKIIERVSHIAFDWAGVDFLFIDGDHSYEGVKADYENYHHHVRSGGLIVFHDIVGYWTVKKLWDEVKIGKKYKEICHSGPDGWGIGILEVNKPN